MLISLKRYMDIWPDQVAAPEIPAPAGSAVKEVEEHDSRAAVLQTMIAMLTRTMSAIAAGGDISATRLQDIEQRLHKASMIEDFQTVKVRLAECLDSLKAETARQRQETLRRVTELREVIEAAGDRAPNRDRVTGLMDSGEAEAAMAEAVADGSAFAVVFVIERLDLINVRFGRPAGDQLLAFFAQHLKQGLSNPDRLYRWSGPSLLALLKRPGGMRQIREEIGNLALRRLAKTIEVQNHAVLLAVSADWAVFPVAEIRPVSELIRTIDAFVHSPQESRQVS